MHFLVNTNPTKCLSAKQTRGLDLLDIGEQKTHKPRPKIFNLSNPHQQKPESEHIEQTDLLVHRPQTLHSSIYNNTSSNPSSPVFVFTGFWVGLVLFVTGNIVSSLLHVKKVTKPQHLIGAK
jgi:hypothetical protein